jgi:alpha-glucosidase
MLFLTLRGTPCLYYGDELALTSGDVPAERVVDCATPSRDPGRTPMPWTRGDGGGWREPWLPLADTSLNVEEQRADPGSTLHYTRDLIALRREVPALRSGSHSEVSALEGVWSWRRGEDAVIALNLGSARAEIGGLDGSIALSTNRARDGEKLDGSLVLALFEGAILV